MSGTNAAPLQGDSGPIQTATGIASAAVSLQMCQGLAATLSSPDPVAPANLAGAGATMAILAVPKLAQRFL